MDKLISAEKLLDRLRANVLVDVTPELEKTILEMPAAFDKETVVEKLEKLSESAREEWNEYDDEYAFGEMNAYTRAIEIVEKGGV